MSNSEHTQQVIFFANLKTKYPEVYELSTAIPMGENRNAITGARLKKEGLRRGYPDILIDYPTSKYHGLRIELKTKNGRVSTHQEKWITLLNSKGYLAVVCYGCIEALRVVDEYLKT